MDKPFIIALDDTLSRLACLVSIVGALCIGSLGWDVLGWALVVFGGLFFWLAREFATAPLSHDLVAPSTAHVGRRIAPERVGQD